MRKKKENEMGKKKEKELGKEKKNKEQNGERRKKVGTEGKERKMVLASYFIITCTLNPGDMVTLNDML